MNPSVLDSIKKNRANGHKAVAILIDPDKSPLKHLMHIKDNLQGAEPDFILVGGSILGDVNIHDKIDTIKSYFTCPVILFPGNSWHVSPNADAILFLSLISGRNPEYLIGQQVIAAPRVFETLLEVIPTGYILIDGGNFTSVSYISQTVPIPSDKTDIALYTAMAGKLLGMQLIYLDAGSGAHNTVPTDMIRAVSNKVNLPLIVGGGIKNNKQIHDMWEAGADVVVIGNVIEKSPDIIPTLKLTQR